jgi:hypothetical protein
VATLLPSGRCGTHPPGLVTSHAEPRRLFSMRSILVEDSYSTKLSWIERAKGRRRRFLTTQDVSDRRNLDGTYRLTVDQAFPLLARASHTTNRNRRDIAEELTRQAPRSNRLQQTRPAADSDAVHLSHALVHPVLGRGFLLQRRSVEGVST